jgi:alkyl hydroperoxide reductase subunit D
MSNVAWFAPIPPNALAGKAAETYERLVETFGNEAPPEPFLIYAHAPAFMHDFYMNFKRFVMTEGKLDLPTKTLVAYAAAVVLDCKPWRDDLAQRCVAVGLTPDMVRGAAAVAAACTTYNVFFKFRDLAGTDVFAGLPVGLRAFTFANAGLEDRVVEILNVAISDLGGCKPCTSGHVEKARQLGVSDEALHEAVQAAAVIAGGAAFLRAAN